MMLVHNKVYRIFLKCKISTCILHYCGVADVTQKCCNSGVSITRYIVKRTIYIFICIRRNSYVYVVISTDDFVSVSVAWIFPGTPLKVNGVPGSVRGNLTAFQFCELCAEVSCIVCYIINDTKILNFPVSHLLFLLHVDAVAIMSTYSLVRACGPIECEIKLTYIIFNYVDVSTQTLQDATGLSHLEKTMLTSITNGRW